MAQAKVPWLPGVDSLETPGTAEQLNGAALWKAYDIPALKAIDTTPLAAYDSDPVICLVTTRGAYLYMAGGSLVPDGEFVIAPDTGPGQWWMLLAHADAIWAYTESYASALGPQLETISDVVAVNVGSISANSELDTTITLTGALADVAIGDELTVTPAGLAPAGIGLVWWAITAPGEIKLRHRNFTGSPIDPASMNYRFTARKY